MDRKITFNVKVVHAEAYPSLRQLRAAYARHLVREVGFSMTVAAEILGVSRVRIYQLVEEYEHGSNPV